MPPRWQLPTELIRYRTLEPVDQPPPRDCHCQEMQIVEMEENAERRLRLRREELMQGSAAVNTKADQLEARHVHVREADLPESFHVHAVADVQREVWTRKWVRRLEEERYAIPLQIDSERINWQKRLQQRNDRAAVRRRDEQQMREAKEKCDEEVQEAMADKDEADKRIKSQKVAARELKERRRVFGQFGEVKDTLESLTATATAQEREWHRLEAAAVDEKNEWRLAVKDEECAEAIRDIKLQSLEARNEAVEERIKSEVEKGRICASSYGVSSVEQVGQLRQSRQADIDELTAQLARAEIETAEELEQQKKTQQTAPPLPERQRPRSQPLPLKPHETQLTYSDIADIMADSPLQSQLRPSPASIPPTPASGETKEEHPSFTAEQQQQQQLEQKEEVEDRETSQQQVEEEEQQQPQQQSGDEQSQQDEVQEQARGQEAVQSEEQPTPPLQQRFEELKRQKQLRSSEASGQRPKRQKLAEESEAEAQRAQQAKAAAERTAASDRLKKERADEALRAVKERQAKAMRDRERAAEDSRRAAGSASATTLQRSPASQPSPLRSAASRPQTELAMTQRAAIRQPPAALAVTKASAAAERSRAADSRPSAGARHRQTSDEVVEDEQQTRTVKKQMVVTLSSVEVTSRRQQTHGSAGVRQQQRSSSPASPAVVPPRPSTAVKRKAIVEQQPEQQAETSKRARRQEAAPQRATTPLARAAAATPSLQRLMAATNPNEALDRAIALIDSMPAGEDEPSKPTQRASGSKLAERRGAGQAVAGEQSRPEQPKKAPPTAIPRQLSSCMPAKQPPPPPAQPKRAQPRTATVAPARKRTAPAPPARSPSPVPQRRQKASKQRDPYDVSFVGMGLDEILDVFEQM